MGQVRQALQATMESAVSDGRTLNIWLKEKLVNGLCIKKIHKCLIVSGSDEVSEFKKDG